MADVGIRPLEATIPTINQLVRKGRRGRKKRRKSASLNGNPFQRGVVLRAFILNPTKPNSGERKCVRVRLTNGKVVTALIPGEKHNLQEHSQVLIKGGGVPDLRSVKYQVVRGALDLRGVEGRAQGRSVYGTKRQ